MYKILVINPGSTSTKIAVFEDESMVMEKTLRHSNEEIARYDTIADQKSFRKEVILESLVEVGINPHDLSAVVGRGGLLHPMEGGTYEVNEKMLEDLRVGCWGSMHPILGGSLLRKLPIRRSFLRLLWIRSSLMRWIPLQEYQVFRRFRECLSSTHLTKKR